ncbi:hypothetical protein MSAN_00603900 [Mycena sanguinolenta]|uniref:F-box domain-containing protein n=1 Tax=Mycena sanguinolenta TaxID=230812 RepID=A0A8H7DGX9_9AGAR|nr:hypothetical protein MSAN_00603900 [Mycena sanguinolenta]
MPRFHDLDKDVLAQILGSCDIYTVLLFQRINKSFRRLALSKQLWISLVLDLSSRYLILHLHPIHTYTTTQLIAKVKSVVCGPETWLERSSVSPAIFSRRTILGEETYWSGFKLISGGRYFAIYNESAGDLQCFDALTGRCVWTRPETPNSWRVDMLHNGHTVNFLLLLRAGLSIVQLDLTTGHSDDVYHLDLHTDTRYWNYSLFGDLLVLNFYHDRSADTRLNRDLVIDWREAVYVIFESPEIPNTYHHVEFVPGHIIFSPPAVEAPHDRLILVYALSSVASRWRPTTELKLHSTDVLSAHCIRLPEDMPPVVVERLEHKNRVFRNVPDIDTWTGSSLQVQMLVYPNPIRDNVYRLAVYASTLRSEEPSLRESFRQRLHHPTGPIRAIGATLFTYQLILGGPKLRWTRAPVISNVPEVIAGWTYAGYGLDWDCKIVGTCSPSGFIRKLRGQTVRDVVPQDERLGPTERRRTRLSSNGVVFTHGQKWIDIVCYL